jgi:spermidine synthase
MSECAAVAPARDGVEHRSQATSGSRPGTWLYLFFFISGFPALLYQIVWQRALFTLYGVNIESVTMVVTAFMLGLGLGSLAGGAMSRSRRLSLLAVFGLVELLIAAYGIFSLKMFHWAADFTAGAGPLQTGLVAFTLVALPTVLMGSTLPILVCYAVRLSRNVGVSVGSLYAVNTLGSACACFCAGLFLMRWLGESKTIALAAGLNATVGATVLIWHFAFESRQMAQAMTRVTTRPVESPSGPETNSPLRPSSGVLSAATGISFGPALLTAGVAGFVSLSYEIVWYRLFSFTTAGLAKSFAFLLGAYLLGIALGSQAAQRICQKVTNPLTFTRFLVGTVVGANLLGFVVAPILFVLVVHVSYLWALVPIGLAAACLGAVFPLLCHISIAPDGRAGTRTSYLYLSNIVGSALGSYLTGFVLMDFLPLGYVTIVLTLAGLGLGIALMLKAELKRRIFVAAALGVFASALFVAGASGPLFNRMYDKMVLKRNFSSPNPFFVALVETRSGVIGVTRDRTVFGGGIYDGRFNVSPLNDRNGIIRAYSLSYFHPDPKEVLMIGLSSGSWAQVIANHPQLEHLTIVEINPGYLRLIRQVPEVANVLQNPKVHIEIDDGRRWLVRNPDRKFDVIVMNTSYNWRSNMSNLLSVEFLQLVRQHLNPGGVHFYNTTDSTEALLTGLSVFPYGMRLLNFMVVSDTPLRLDADRWRNVLVNYKIDDKPLFDLSQELPRLRLGEMLSLTATMDSSADMGLSLESADHIRGRTAGVRVITDDNMGTEWLQ